MGRKILCTASRKTNPCVPQNKPSSGINPQYGQGMAYVLRRYGIISRT
jgi:hypothetical protein